MAGESSGPCEQCEHVRFGESVSRLAFKSLFPLVQPKAQKALALKMQEEAEQAGNARAEVDGLRALGADTYNRRPFEPKFEFCGVTEFDNTYHCSQLKNIDLRCPDFTPKRGDPEPHSCRTCKHSHATSPRVNVALEQLLRPIATGKKLLDDAIRPACDLRAEVEYRECVDTAGFLSMKPAFLPECTKLSGASAETGDPVFVVGPVVNSAARCVHWIARTEPQFAESDARLDALIARIGQLRALADEMQRRTAQIRSLNIEHMMDTGYRVEQDLHTPADHAAADANYRNRLIGAVTNAECDLIAFCLEALGDNPESIQVLCSDWSGGHEWTPGLVFEDPYHLSDGTEAPPAPTTETPIATPEPSPLPIDGSQAPPIVPAPTQSEPFAMQPGIIYQHPNRPDLRVAIQVDGSQVVGILEIDSKDWFYDLAQFPSGEWTQLQNERGFQPVTLLVELPNAVHAAWRSD